MASKVERYRQLYGRRKDNLLDLVLPAGAAYDRARDSGKLGEDDLRVIVDTARHERTLVAMNAVELLEAMSELWPAEVSRAIVELFSSAKAHVRFAAICALTSYIDVAVACDVLKGGLKDKSASVRWKAADLCLRLNRRDLIPRVEETLAAEKNARSRKSIDFDLKLLRDGYVRKDYEDGTISLTVRTAQGTAGRLISGKELKEKGIDVLVDGLRRNGN